MITTIATRFSFAALGLALATLAAGPAVSAVYPEKQLVAETSATDPRVSIEIVAPATGEALGTIRYSIGGGKHTTGLPFGGPR